MTNHEASQQLGGGQHARTTAVAPRELWARTSTRIAWIAGVFSLVLGCLLVFNTIRLYRGPGNGKVRLVEARELLPLKTALREDPKNEPLKQQIRLLDQQLRHEYFRRERLAARGGWLLLGGAALFLAALQLARQLRRPPVPVPHLSARPEDPAAIAALAAKAVTGTTLALAGLTLALVWDTGRQWQGDRSNASGTGLTPAAPGAAGAAGTAALDPGWFPSAADIARNWPYFRGPAGSGITTLTDLPETWDGPSGKNVLLEDRDRPARRKLARRLGQPCLSNRCDRETPRTVLL